MNTDPAHSAQMPSNRILASAAILAAGLALVLYYLVPVPIRPLGFSPHVLALSMSFLFLLSLRSAGIQQGGLIIALVFLGAMLFSILSAPAAPNTTILRTWLVSLLAFWVFCNTFDHFPKHTLDVGVQMLLALWSLVAIGQVLSGGGWYVSSWFGAPIVSVYAAGFTIYSNYAALALLPLLTWTLVCNLDRPAGWRSLLWLAGCAALYFTLSRAGWLALLIAMLVLALRLRRHPGKMRGLALHAVLALLAVLLAWAAPTRIDSYEFMGERSMGRWNVLDSAGDSAGDYSAATRLITLQVAAKAVGEYPLSGIGLGRFPEYYAKHHVEYLGNAAVDPRVRMTPHNGYAQLAAEAGMPALLVLLLWLGWLLRQAGRSMEPDVLALYASMIGMAGWLLFHDGLYDRQLWILAGCLTALVARRAPLGGGL